MECNKKMRFSIVLTNVFVEQRFLRLKLMTVRDFVVFCSFSVDNSYFKNKFKRNFKIYMCQLVMNSKDTTLPNVFNNYSSSPNGILTQRLRGREE